MPQQTYDFFVIGTGPAGQSIAVAAARAGKKTGIVDSRAFGGVCPLRGCDPKKVLHAAAKAMDNVAKMKQKGFTSLPAFDWGDDRHPDTPLRDTVFYEAHVKGLTALHPHAEPRGTFLGLASDPVIEHLHRLGVTAIELLPSQAFLNDAFLVEKGLTFGMDLSKYRLDEE